MTILPADHPDWGAIPVSVPSSHDAFGIFQTTYGTASSTRQVVAANQRVRVLGMGLWISFAGAPVAAANGSEWLTEILIGGFVILSAAVELRAISGQVGVQGQLSTGQVWIPGAGIIGDPDQDLIVRTTMTLNMGTALSSPEATARGFISYALEAA